MNQKKMNLQCTFAVHILIVLLLLPIILVAFAGCADIEAEFVLPTRTLSEDAEKLSYSYFRYKIYDDDTVILTEYKGEATNVVIPDEIEGRRVVALAPQLFYQNQLLESVTIGKNLEEIGTKCFGGCSFLSDVSIGKNVWSIGAYAFSGTPWFDALADEYVIVGDGVLIKYNGNADGVVIPDTVRHIGDVFTMSGIVSVTMSDSVLSVGEYAFAFCALLRNVDFSENLLLIKEYAFVGCEALPSLILPNSVEQIGNSAFYDCLGLNTVRLGESLTTLGEYAFFNCTQMRMLYLPSTLTALPVGAFEGCGSLELVLYAGDEKTFKSIVADTTNFLLLDAMIVYNAASGG